MKVEKELFTWYGKPNKELTREELLDVIVFLKKEIDRLKKDQLNPMDFLFKMRKK